MLRALLALTPRDFRVEFGDEICRVAEERWAERADSLNGFGRARFWVAEATALIVAKASTSPDSISTSSARS